MRKWLATLGASLAIGLAGCDNAPDTKAVEAQQAPAITASAPVNKTTATTQIKVNDACNYNAEPSEAEVIATREQKEFWMKAHQELNKTLSKYKYVPSGDKPESDGTTYYKWWRDGVVIFKTDSKDKNYPWVYYDVTIKLQSPVTIEWRQYGEVYLNVTPDPSFSLTKFQNPWDTFPKLRFWHSDGKKDNPDILCLTSRYYDDVDWIRLSDKGSQGKAVPFKQENFNSLIKIALEKIKK
jgi:hypothetical protein